MTALSNDEIARYSRHLILPEVGKKGQEKLKNSAVLLVGAGGLGSPLALYLAAAGIGKIGIIDFDKVDESNLQRQIIHGTSTLGKSKLSSARDRIKDLNPNVEVEGIEAALTSDNALDIVKRFDVVADGTDNFPTRYLVNDACVLTGTPNVYGSIFRFEGQVSVFNYEDGPCYRCLYSEPPPPGLVPSCAEGGVLGVLPGVVGCLQATEVIKVLLGIGKPAKGKLILYDALNLSFRELKLRRNPKCVDGECACIDRLIDYQQFCGVPTSHLEETEVPSMNVSEYKKFRDDKQNHHLIDVREPHEYDICHIQGSLLIPKDTLNQSIDEFKKDDVIIVHCKSGGRSSKAVEFLQNEGFTNVKNLTGGILEWADKIEPDMPKY